MDHKKLMRFKDKLLQKSPKITLFIGLAGTVTASIMCVTATPKALELIERAKSEKNEELTPQEKVKAAWKCYVPAAAVEALSLSCIIFSHTQTDRRNAALAAAYTLSENKLREYQQKVIGSIGEKKEKNIRDEIAKDEIEKHPVSAKEVILTGNGDALCYDTISGRYFRSDIDKIKKAENVLNRTVMEEMCASLNDFYYEIDLEPVKLGEYLGWNTNNGMLNLDFSSQLTKDGTPCLVIDYTPAPKYDFQRY